MSTTAKHGATWTLLPLAFFAAVALLFYKGLSGDPKAIPSALIGSTIGEFTLPEIPGLGVPGLAAEDLKSGKVTVVNVWASWCGPCRGEHPLLMDLSRRGDIALAGINYKDKTENAVAFLTTLGQPFARAGRDEKGRAAIDWGVYGVPETFVVDGRGVIRFKWIGPLDAKSVAENLLPEIEKAKSAP